MALKKINELYENILSKYAAAFNNMRLIKPYQYYYKNDERKEIDLAICFSDDNGYTYEISYRESDVYGNEFYSFGGWNNKKLEGFGTPCHSEEELYKQIDLYVPKERKIKYEQLSLF